MAESGTAGKIFNYGCLGCLGLIGAVVLVVGLLGGSAYLSVRNEEPERKTVSRAIGASGAADAAAEAGAEEPRGEGVADPANRPGLFLLDLRNAEIEVEPGQPGDRSASTRRTIPTPRRSRKPTRPPTTAPGPTRSALPARTAR